MTRNLRDQNQSPAIKTKVGNYNKSKYKENNREKDPKGGHLAPVEPQWTKQQAKKLRRQPT